MTKNEVIYAVQVGKISTPKLEILNVKVGRTKNIETTLRNYKRGSLEAKILDLWKPNKELSTSECEVGVHDLAEKYAFDREGEKFIFLQDSYRAFSKNVSKLLEKATRGRRKAEKKKEEEKYTLERHLERSGGKSREWFQSLEGKILKLNDDIVEKPLKQYVAYKLNGNFAEVVIQKNQLRVTLDIPPEKLEDPEGRVEDKSGKGHWATGDQMFYVKSTKDVGYAIDLIKQSLKISTNQDQKSERVGKLKSFTGKKPNIVRFGDENFNVSTWRGVVRVVAKKIYREVGDFSKVTEIKGRERDYFTKNKDALRDPKRIPGTPYYFEANISAEQLMQQLVYPLLNKFGYDKGTDLEISVESSQEV